MSKLVLSRRKTVIVGLTAAMAITGSGVAFAWWSSLGTGDGSATTAASSATLTITPGPQVGVLQPGGASVTVPFTVTNTGSAPVMVQNATVTLADSEGAAWVPPVGCAIAGYHVSAALTGGAQEIDAAATAAGTVTITLEDLESDQNACKDASLPLHISVS
jgi:hypothetical protein